MDPYDELDALLARAGFGERQLRALRRRLGWDGGPPVTLAEAAASEGYTRERVRQLERRLREHVRSTRPSLPATRAALRKLERTAPLRCDTAERTLLRAAEIAGIDLALVERDGVVLRITDLGAFRRAVRAARILVRRDGATTPAPQPLAPLPARRARAARPRRLPR
jgi:hypothetical protein